MNDLEKTIVNIDMNINDYSNKEIKTYEKKQNITNKRKSEQDKLTRRTSKVKRLNEELDRLKTNKISTHKPKIMVLCATFSPYTFAITLVKI